MKFLENIFKGWIIPIVVAFIISLLIRQFLFFSIKVPSESMYPTIKPGDQLIVTRIYNTNNLKRGNVVVFHSDELNMDLIKRLIGLPGDTVEVKGDGSVYVNSVKIEEKYVSSPAVKFGNFKVPQGKFLFFGDNRQNSLDSRYWVNPYIDKSSIKGIARITIFPFNRFSLVK